MAQKTNGAPNLAQMEKAMKQNMDKAAKSFDDVAAFGKDNVDAMVKAANIYVKGAEQVSAELMAFTKQSIEEGVAHAKDMAGVKDVNAIVAQNQAYAQKAFDAYVRETAKVSDMWMAVAKEAFEPINARVDAAAEMAKGYKFAA